MKESQSKRDFKVKCLKIDLSKAKEEPLRLKK